MVRGGVSGDGGSFDILNRTGGGPVGGCAMKPVAFAQLLLVLVISYILVLVILDKSIPAPLLLVLGVLCPSPLQAGASAVFGAVAGQSVNGGGTNDGGAGGGNHPA